MGAGASALEGLSADQHDMMEKRYNELKATGMQGPQILEKLGGEVEQLKAEAAGLSALERARQRVSALTSIISREAAQNFLVAVDGSDSSNAAVEVCLRELMKSRDCISALHAFDSTKKYESLAESHKPEELREAISIKLMTRTSKDRHSLNWVDKKGQETKPFVLKVVNDIADHRESLPLHMRPSFFVTGITGRKGSKVGSLPAMAAGQFHLPNIIIKNAGPVVDRPRVFVAAIKDLEHTAQYYVAQDLLKPGKGDKVSCELSMACFVVCCRVYSVRCLSFPLCVRS